MDVCFAYRWDYVKKFMEKDRLTFYRPEVNYLLCPLISDVVVYEFSPNLNIYPLNLPCIRNLNYRFRNV